MASSPNNVSPIPIANPNPQVPESGDFWHHRMHCQNVFQTLFSYWNPESQRWVGTIGTGAQGSWFTPYYNVLWSAGGWEIPLLTDEGELNTTDTNEGGWDALPPKNCIDANYASLIHYDTPFWIRGEGEPYVTSMAEIMFGIDKETDIISQDNQKTSEIPAEDCRICRDVESNFHVPDTIVSDGFDHGDWIDLVNTTPSNSYFGYYNGSLVKVEFPWNYSIPEFDLKRNYFRDNYGRGGNQAAYWLSKNTWPTEVGISPATFPDPYGTGSAYSSSTNGYWGYPNETNPNNVGDGVAFNYVPGAVGASSASDHGVSMAQWKNSQKFGMPIWYVEHTGCLHPHTTSIVTAPASVTSSVWLQEQGVFPNMSQSGLNMATATQGEHNYISLTHHRGNLNPGIDNGTPFGGEGAIWYYTSSYGLTYTFMGIEEWRWQNEGTMSALIPPASITQGSPAYTYYYPMTTGSYSSSPVKGVTTDWYHKIYLANASLSACINIFAEFSPEQNGPWSHMYALQDAIGKGAVDISMGRMKYVQTRSCLQDVRLVSSYSLSPGAGVGTGFLSERVDYTASKTNPILKFGDKWWDDRGGRLSITTPIFYTQSTTNFPLKGPNHTGTDRIFNKYNPHNTQIDTVTSIANAITWYTDFVAVSASDDNGAPIISYSSHYCSASYSDWSGQNNRMGLNNIGTVEFRYYQQNSMHASESASFPLETPKGWMHPYGHSSSYQLRGFLNYSRAPIYDWWHYDQHLWKGQHIKIEFLGDDRNVKHPKAWHSFSKHHHGGIGMNQHDSSSWGFFGSFWKNTPISDHQAYSYDITSSITVWNPYGDLNVKTGFSADQTNQFSHSVDGINLGLHHSWSFNALFPCAEYLYDISMNPMPQWRQFLQQGGDDDGQYTHRDDPVYRGGVVGINGNDIEHALYTSYEVFGSSGSIPHVTTSYDSNGVAISTDGYTMGASPTIVYQTFKNNQNYYSKRPGCTCTKIRQWYNVPLRYHSSAKDFKPVTDRKLSQNVWELKFSDDFSFKCGGGLLLFMYDPTQQSNTVPAYDYWSGSVIQDSYTWPANLRTVAVKDLARYSASVIMNNHVAFIKCNDLIPGTTHENGFVYLKDIRRTDSDMKLDSKFDTDWINYNTMNATYSFANSPGTGWPYSGSWSGSWKGHGKKERGRYQFHTAFDQYHFKLKSTSSMQPSGCSGSDPTDLLYDDHRAEFWPYYTKIITDWPNDLKMTNKEYFETYGPDGCNGCKEGATLIGSQNPSDLGTAGGGGQSAQFTNGGGVYWGQGYNNYHCGIVGCIMLENGLYVAFHGSQVETKGYRGDPIGPFGPSDNIVADDGTIQSEDWPRVK